MTRSFPRRSEEPQAFQRGGFFVEKTLDRAFLVRAVFSFIGHFQFLVDMALRGLKDILVLVVGFEETAHRGHLPLHLAFCKKASLLSQRNPFTRQPGVAAVRRACIPGLRVCQLYTP